MIYKNILFPLILIISSLAVAQTELKTFQKKYPNENGVYLNHNENATIKVNKEGMPEISSELYEERLFLTENYKYYMESSIHFSSFTEVEDVKPNVYKYDGTKYKKTAIKNITEEDTYSAGVFHDDNRAKKFFYKGLEIGGKTELSYTKNYNEPYFFGSFYFSSYLPVESSTYSVTTPSDMEILFTVFGNDKDKVKYKKETKGSLTTHTWSAKELKALDSEGGALDVSYFATHIIVRIGNYTHKGKSKYLLRDVNDLHEYYRDFVNEVNKDDATTLINIADSLTKDIASNDEKVKAIFYWVQDNIKYVAFEDGLGGFIPREASLVCSRRYGDCKDMASILYRMINSVGVPAYYTWIGSRDIPYTYNQVPTPKVDNHMICSYHNGEKYVFLDATGKLLPFGMPTPFIQGKQALITKSETDYDLITVEEIPAERNLTIDTVYAKIGEETLSGTAHVTYTGYTGRMLKDAIINMDNQSKQDFYKNAFKKGNNKCTSNVTKTTGIGDRDSNLVMKYEFEIPDYIRQNKNELYINPFLKKYHKEAKINLKTTQLDKENTYREINNNVIIYELPKGYTVDYLPESISKKSDFFSFEVVINHNKSKHTIEVQTNFDMDYLVLEKEDFKQWNEIISALNNAYSELIILKKI